MNQKCKTIGKKELMQTMQYLSNIYDIVRIVDPKSTSVMKFTEDKLVKIQKEPCFAVWEKGERCQNCISNQACVEGRRITKFEFRQEEAYYVLAVPYRIIDGEKELLISMELVNRVTSDFILQSHGVDQTSNLIRAINNKSYEDSLTGTFNRRYYDEKRYLYDDIHNFPKEFGFLMIDINQFRNINDKYGHTHADELLAKVGEILRRSFRNTDKVIRIGGDEFIVVVKECSHMFLENKIVSVKRAISEIRFEWMGEMRLSVSIGMSYTNSFLGKKDQIEELYRLADDDMYRDKNSPLPLSSSKTILIVDDVAMNRDLIKVELKDRFHLLEAESGQDALIILKTNHVDLIITDIFMNPMNGYEFMKCVRKNQNTKNISIIAITENTESSQSKAIASGADIYIDRPTKQEQLVKAIMQLTGQDYGRRELFSLDFVLDSIPGAVLVCKFETDIPDIIYCSRGTHNIAGLESNEFCELITKNGPDILYAEDRQKFINCVKKIIKTHSRGEIIFRTYKADGSMVWLWMQGRYIGEEKGKPIIEEIILDVSNSTNMYESILDEASSLITVIDVETQEVLYTNKKAESILGNSSGKFCYQYFYNQDKECTECTMLNAKSEISEKVCKYNDRYYKQVFKKMRWNGRLALLKCMEDITEQRTLQEYAEKEKNNLSQFVQNIPAGLFVFHMDTEHRIEIIAANPSAVEMMGIDPTKTIGSGAKEVFELTHPEDRPLMADVIAKLSVPNTTVAYEYRQFIKDKEEYGWLYARAHSVPVAEGGIDIYIGYIDITEQKKAQKLRDDLKIAQKENQAKTDFMSNMSHDMRTPLNGILGLAYLMQEKNDVNELHQDINRLIASGKLLLNLVNDTLDISKIEAGKMELDMKQMDSASVFTDVITTVGMVAKQAGISLELDLPDIPKDQWLPVISDASRLEQVLINIITNAIKYSESGSTVELHMENISVTEDTVTDRYTIVDHGIGMSEEFLPHLFEPFVQEGRLNNSTGQGSGLGMAIVKQFVDMMGGEISVESKLNVGTTVSIVMHYERYKGEIPAKKTVLSHGENLDGMRILVCEDHPLNQQIVMQLLKKKGILVELAENGKIGLEKFEQSAPGYYDLILMDIRMPVMDGITTAKAIRSMEREDAGKIPILAMTANAFAEDKEETKQAGMNEHLSKPVQPEILFDTLKKYYMDHEGRLRE